MSAAEIMTEPVVSVAAEDTIAEAARLMLQQRISGLPVIDKSGMMVGIVTEGDLLRRFELGTERRRRRWIELLMGPGRLAGEYVDTHARKVGEVMTGTVVSVTPQDPLSDVVELMEKRHIKRVPVVDGARLVGIISRANLVRALVHSLTQKAETSATVVFDDAEIHDAIHAVIDKEPWSPRFSVDVTVTNGIVDLRGTVTDERERVALRVAAENIAGVKAVRDHIVWVEPTSGLVIPAPDADAA